MACEKKTSGILLKEMKMKRMRGWPEILHMQSSSLELIGKVQRNRNCSYLFFLFGDGLAAAASVFFLFGDGQATLAMEQWQRRLKQPDPPSPATNAEIGQGRSDLSFMTYSILRFRLGK
ncbi:hypothetical protein MRB53_019764 [Persea americana]|uniref:Uncharacterized protein n=1 Tax=Persea americana TaxID=3435 RepID=A0ACC2KYZ8_PERAE|nr:hypothetical protein MRB53_019764 [Persea americana]